MVFSAAAFHYATANSAYANLRAECQQALIYIQFAAHDGATGFPQF